MKRGAISASKASVSAKRGLAQVTVLGTDSVDYGAVYGGIVTFVAEDMMPGAVLALIADMAVIFHRCDQSAIDVFALVADKKIKM